MDPLTNRRHVENLSQRSNPTAAVHKLLNIIDSDDPYTADNNDNDDDESSYLKLKYYYVGTPATSHIPRTLSIIALTAFFSSMFYFILLGPIIDQLASDFSMARSQSLGFFNDISSSDWHLMRSRVKESDHHHPTHGPDKWTDSPEKWHSNNWDPVFTCYHERRVGGLGVGGKWVCDPHRIKEKRGKCLVYSIGTQGKFDFEEDLRKIVGPNRCEIHIFEPYPEKLTGIVPEHYIFHPWGFKSESSSISSSNFKTLGETIDILGHDNMVIDIFKIDCEHCEWTTYKEWLTGEAELKQILVEVHTSPSEHVAGFFESMREYGYVIFHKEPNIQFGGGKCVEYGFLKLHKQFFDD